MLRWFIRRRLAAFTRTYGYDTTYMGDVLDADVAAFLKFARVSSISSYRKGVPAAPWYAAKIVGAMAEDCGPCTQLVVTMAEHDRVEHDVLRAVLAGDTAAMPEDVAIAFRFARAVLAHAPEADELREQAVARWGQRGLVSLGFALTSARMFPTLKYALGHGRSCTRVTVAGTAAPVQRHAA